MTGSSTTTTTTASTDITETGDANEGQNPPPTPPVHPAVIPLDTHPESRSRTPQTGTPLDGNRPFTFFRSFRFPSRSLANVLLSSIDPAIASSLAPSGGFSGPRPATTSAPPAEPAAAAASTTTTDQSQSPHPEVVVGAAANSPATPSNPSPGAVPAGQNSSVPTRSDIVPMLLVGVRSVSALIVHHQGAPSEATPSSTAADANASAGASQVPSNVDDDGDVQMADASQGVPSLPTSHPASGENEPMSAPRSSFVLWIMVSHGDVFRTSFERATCQGTSTHTHSNPLNPHSHRAASTHPTTPSSSPPPSWGTTTSRTKTCSVSPRSWDSTSLPLSRPTRSSSPTSSSSKAAKLQSTDVQTGFAKSPRRDV